MNTIVNLIEIIKKEKSVLFLIIFNIFVLYFIDSSNSNSNFPHIQSYSGLLLSFSLLLILIKIIFETNIKILNNNLRFFFYSLVFVFFAIIKISILGKSNIEHYADFMVSSFVWLKNFFNYPFISWLDGRGMGIPYPLIPSLNINPFLLLYYFFGIKFFYILLWLTHLLAGTFFFMKIGSLVDLNQKLSIFVGFLFCFSAPMVNYLPLDDWTANFISWSLLPAILYFPIKYIINENKISRNNLILYSFFLTYYFYNGTPSIHFTLFFLFIVSLIYFFIFPLKNIDLKSFILIAIIVIVLCLPRVFHIYTEMKMFSIAYENEQASQLATHSKFIALQWYKLVDNLFPFFNNQIATILDKDNGITRLQSSINSDGFNHIFNYEILTHLKEFDFFKIMQLLQKNIFGHSNRNYFLGLIFILLAFASIKSIKSKNKPSNKKTILSLFYFIFILSLILMHFRTFYTFNYMNEVYFGLPIIFSGIILATYFLSKLSMKSYLVKILLIIQLLQYLAYASFGAFIYPASSYNQVYSTNFFKTDKNNDFYQRLKKISFKYGNNLILSPKIESDLNMELPFLKIHNLYSIQDIYLNTGIEVLNDFHLKGISMDLIYPSPIQIYSVNYKKGEILSSYDLLNNKQMLDVLGINLILIKKDEFDNITNDEYIIIDDFIMNRTSYRQKKYSDYMQKLLSQLKPIIQKEKWLVLLNQNAWGEAFALNQNIVNNNQISTTFNCLYPFFICQNMQIFHDNKMDINIKEDGQNGKYSYSFKQQDGNFVIGVSKIYRKQWSVYSNNIELETFAINNSLLGIKIPAGVTKINLEYRDNVRLLLIYLSLIVLCLLLILLLKTNIKFQLSKN